MSNNILEPKFMLEVVKNIEIPRAYIGQNYLPMVDVSTEALTWDVLKDEQNLGGVYSIDGQIRPGSEAIFGQMFADVCRIGAARLVSESEWRKLRDPGMAGIETGMVGDIKAEVTRKVAQKLVDCNREVDATLEYLRINALLGYIKWPPEPATGKGALGNAVFAVDYRLPSDHKVKATDANLGGGGYFWTTIASADIVKDLEAIQVFLADEGGDPTQLDMIMSRHALKLAMQQASFIDIMKYTNPSGLMNFGAAAQYIETTLGIRPVIYDTQYTYRTVSTTDPSDITINRVRILPTNYVLFVPRNTKVGDVATSPAEANGWRTGKFTWLKKEVNPWKTELGEGINAFPRLTKPESIFVLQIEQDPKGLKAKK